MPYVAGPLTLQDASNVAIPAKSYDFTDDALFQLGSLDVIGAEWDGLFGDMNLAADEPSDPFPDVDLNAVIDLIDVYANSPLGIDFGSVIVALGASDVGLAAAIGAAPVEAWQNSSTQFVAPAPAETIAIPVIPPGAISFSVSGTVSSGGGITPGTPGAPAMGVTLTNTTAYGSPNFTVGDNFIVVAYGSPGSVVSVDATLNGVELGLSTYGAIGTDGTFSLTGQMDPSAIGVWSENWYIDGAPMASFNFVVLE